MKKVDKLLDKIYLALLNNKILPLPISLTLLFIFSTITTFTYILPMLLLFLYEINPTAFNLVVIIIHLFYHFVLK